jgi:uncharacterized protein YggL (DUF469 family)
VNKLTPEDLHSLEAYAKLRPEFRARVMEHKRHRRLPLGEHITLIFEDRLTMHYQVQEMLRAERIFEEQGILDELNVYNSLIPGGSNWKATMMVEYEDEEERRLALQRLVGIEDQIWIQIGDSDPVRAIADEDIERSTESKTSAVHFLRFELPADRVAALKSGASLRAGVSNSHYSHTAEASEAMRESLIADLD